MDRIWLENYPKNVPANIDDKAYKNVVELLEESFKKYGNLPAFSCMGKTLTFSQLDERSMAFGAYLRHRGLKPGDKLALMMPNLLQYPIALFGALRAGITVVNTNPLYTEREMKHQFQDAGVKAIVICENFAFNLEKIIKDTDIDMVILASIGELLGTFKGTLVNFVVRNVKRMVPKFDIANTVTFKTALNTGKGLTLEKIETELDDVILIQYTGGTTGVAKGAMLTNHNLVANMMMVKACMMGSNIEYGKEVMLTPLPMYHIFSFTVNCLCMVAIGGLSVLVTNPRDQKALLKTMAQNKLSMMTGVNTLFNALNNNPEFAKLDFSGLKLVVGGAMAIQRPVAEKWQQITGVPLTEGYGMTEASPVVSVNPFDGTGRLGTIGIPLPSTEMRIVGEDGEVKGIGERGEIQARGPQVMKGYYNQPEATAKTITSDGWLCTGDVGIMDSDGYVTIVDRIKDMILVSGFNVYPNEIEEVVASHQKVLEVAAIGVKDENSGEAVKIFVVKKDQSLTKEELKSFCAKNMTGYKKPKHIEFRDELPKTNVGKILRRALREE